MAARGGQEMGSQTNKPRRSTAIALTLGVLVMSFVAPALAGDRSADIRGHRVPTIFPAPSPPPPSPSPPPIKPKRSIGGKQSFQHLGLSGSGGAWTDALLSLVSALDASSPATPGAEDEGAAF